VRLSCRLGEPPFRRGVWLGHPPTLPSTPGTRSPRQKLAARESWDDRFFPMLARADAAQNKTLERLKHFLDEQGILFTLVGSAACREYGLSRTANDLDFVVDPYDPAMKILGESGGFEPVLGDPDPTKRTCTKRDTKTTVKVDFLTGGIRINDGPVPFYCRDLIPIPMPTGTGDVASLRTLIAMKLNSAISGEYIWSHGVRDGRSEKDFKKDISDVRELILVPGFDRSMKFDNEGIQHRYEELLDGKV
jgi:hypothetical protein